MLSEKIRDHQVERNFKIILIFDCFLIFGWNFRTMATTIQVSGKKNIRQAAAVLADAFRDDPLFHYAFGSLEAYNRYAPWMFATWVKWGVLYAKVWTTSNFESVAIRRFPGNPGYNLLTMIRSGIIFTPFKTGFGITRRLNKVVGAIEMRHTHLMRNTPHIYCQNIGTGSEFRGKGFGKILMNHTFEMADQMKLPCYLETTTEKNMLLHQNHGYQLIETFQINNTPFKTYIMLRQPLSQTNSSNGNSVIFIANQGDFSLRSK